MGHTGLPAWLQMEQTAAGSRLAGVPTDDHAGRQYYLELVSTAAAAAADTPSADVFSVKVVSEPVAVGGAVRAGERGAVQCDAGSSVTMAGVLLAASLDGLSGGGRVALLRDVSRHLDLPAAALRLTRPANKALFDSSALVAGAGDVRTAGGPTLHLQWQVGCGNVHAHQMPILQRLEATAADGRMAAAVGYGVVGWHVSNKKAVTPHRVKRYADVRPTATRIPTGGVPTKAPKLTVDMDKDKSRRPHKPSKKVDKTGVVMPSRPPIAPTRSVVTPGPTQVWPSKPQPYVPTSHRPTPPLQPSVAPTQVARPTRPTQLLPTATLRTLPPTEAPAWTPIPAVSTTTESLHGPIVKNEIKTVRVAVGDILHHKIPKNTFFDFEDGNTRGLKLLLLTKEGSDLPSDTWIKLNARQALYGMPMEADIGKHDFCMTAYDEDNNMIREVFTVIVTDRSAENEINHEFSLGIDLDYESFMRDVDQRMEVARKIAHVYGDRDARHMMVTRLEKGSVVYAWTNTSLSGDGCPVDQIAHLLSFLITANQTLNETMLRRMKPYRVLRASGAPRGACDFDDVPAVVAADGEDGDGVASEPRAKSDDRVMITTVLPAVIIAIMLLLCAFIACCLYRKRRSGKLSDEDKETYHSKGVPVIFEDELDENNGPSSKPLIGRDEKPPQSPPDYGDGIDDASTPDSLRKQHLLDTTVEDDDDTVDYRRPPPVSGSLDSRGEPRPLAQTLCRQPPPYVAP